MFDTVIGVYHETESILAPDADVVENNEFETVIVKIQNSKISELTPEESSAVESLKLPMSAHSIGTSSINSTLMLAERALNRRRMLDSRFLIPTSNI